MGSLRERYPLAALLRVRKERVKSEQQALARATEQLRAAEISQRASREAWDERRAQLARIREDLVNEVSVQTLVSNSRGGIKASDLHISRRFIDRLTQEISAQKQALDEAEGAVSDLEAQVETNRIRVSKARAELRVLELKREDWHRDHLSADERRDELSMEDTISATQGSRGRISDRLKKVR